MMSQIMIKIQKTIILWKYILIVCFQKIHLSKKYITINIFTPSFIYLLIMNIVQHTILFHSFFVALHNFIARTTFMFLIYH